MSRKNNVNPDHYKVAGRDRPNENLLPEPYVRDGAGAKGGPRPNAIPGTAPIGKASTRGKRTAARGRRKAV
jgi:hypothetical protein